MRKILIAVDLQNDFIDGALGTKEAQAIVKNAVDKINTYPAENIYATRDTHGENYMDTNEGRHLPVKHCIKGTDGREIQSEIKKALRGAHIIDKPTFGSKELAELLKAENEKEPIEIELIGLCTDICVISNALLLKAYMPEVDISVDSACCAGVTPESHDKALDTMRMCQVDVK